MEPEGVVLTTPEGRFNLSTPEGADGFLAARRAEGLITRNAAALGNTAVPLASRIAGIHIWGVLAQSADPSSLELVPREEKECLVSTIFQALAREAGARAWKR